MEAAIPAKTSSSSVTGQRRQRPNSYSSHACERCRLRKQRCLSTSSQDNACQNCVFAGVTCDYATREERPSKRGRVSSEEDRTRFTPSPLTLSSHPAPSSGLFPSSLRRLAMSAPAPTSSPAPTAPPAQQIVDSGQQPSISPTGVHSEVLPPDWDTWFSQTSPTRANIHHIRAQTINPLDPPLDSAHGDRVGLADPDGSDHPSLSETAKSLAMISLEAAAEPHYVGDSSGSLWMTVIAKGMQSSPGAVDGAKSDHTRQRARSPSPTHRALLKANLQRPISDEVADALLEMTYRHVHARYPFMDWIAFDVHWQARDGILLAVAQDRPLNKEAASAAFFILMVFGIGVQHCTSTISPGLLQSEEYYALALPYLNTIVQLHNLANVQGLLLLAMFSLRDSRGPSIWYLSGVCMRLCIGLGLHRREPLNVTRYQAEMRKRVFWSCYTLDRMMVMILGRPPGISDDDIDIGLPDPASSTIGVSLPSMRTASVISAIHHIKLRRIESRIQRALYTVAKRHSVANPDISLPLLRSIDEWETDVPVEASNCVSFPCCSRDWFMLRGVEARLHVLRHLCSVETDQASSLLASLAQTASRGCELQKRLHLSAQSSSMVLVHSTFVCGISLLYCVFVKPDILSLKDLFSAIKAASNTLFAYHSNGGSSKALFDVFEELSSICLEKISRHRVGQVDTGIVGAAKREWKRASVQATTGHLDLTLSGEFTDFMEHLDMSSGAETNSNDLNWDMPTLPFGELFSELA